MSGPPSAYTTEIGEQILDRLWAGETLTAICRGIGFKPRTVRGWAKIHKDFGADYEEAMVGGAHALIDSTIEISDGLKEDPASRKVRIYAREQYAKRKAPKVFGDRMQLAGDPDQPLQGMTREQIDARLRELGVDPEALGNG